MVLTATEAMFHGTKNVVKMAEKTQVSTKWEKLIHTWLR